MAQQVNYEIVGSYNNQLYPSIDAERSVNLFEYIDPSGKKPKSLIFTSGLINQFVDYSPVTTGFRAQFVFGNFFYSVIENKVFKQAANLVPQIIGTITGSVGYVAMDANTYQIIIIDTGSNHGYIYDTITGSFTQITDPGFPSAPIDVCYLDGFFVVANGGTNDFYLSANNQGLVWSAVPSGSSTFTITAPTSDIVLTSNNNLYYQVGITIRFSGTVPPPLNTTDLFYVVFTSVAPSPLNVIRVSATLGGLPLTFAANGSGTIARVPSGTLQKGSITSHPGTFVGCRTLHRRLFLFSQNFTEVWENAGIGTTLPFRRNNALLMEFGCAAIGSIKTGFDLLFFLSRDKDGLGSVMEVIGAQAIPISNRALDVQLQQYDSTTGISDATGVLLKENGMIFYRLNFTSSNHTFVFNASLSSPQQVLWHEEEVLNGNRHPAQTHVFFNGKNYYGDYLLPILYEVNPKTLTNAGESIKRMRIGRAIGPEGYQRLRMDRFHLDLVQGSVEDSTVNQQPVVFLSYSKNGGQSFGNRLIANMGFLGQRSFRTVWRKLGTVPRGQAFVPKIEFFAHVPFVILGAAWVYEQMPE